MNNDNLEICEGTYFQQKCKMSATCYKEYKNEKLPDKQRQLRNMRALISSKNVECQLSVTENTKMKNILINNDN